MTFSHCVLDLLRARKVSLLNLWFKPAQIPRYPEFTLFIPSANPLGRVIPFLDFASHFAVVHFIFANAKSFVHFAPCYFGVPLRFSLRKIRNTVVKTYRGDFLVARVERAYAFCLHISMFGKNASHSARNPQYLAGQG